MTAIPQKGRCDSGFVMRVSFDCACNHQLNKPGGENVLLRVWCHHDHVLQLFLMTKTEEKESLSSGGQSSSPQQQAGNECLIRLQLGNAVSVSDL
jgi:hypothetical protein